MKTITPAMQSHLESSTHTLTTCWKVITRLGDVYGFTSHDDDIEIDDITYRGTAAMTGLTLESKSDLSVDNLEVSTFTSAASLDGLKIMAGLFDGAEVYLFMVNYLDLTMGEIPLKSGVLGEISAADNNLRVEFRSLSQHLNQSLGSVYSPTCRATFGSQIGDEKWWCGIDKNAFTFAGTVSAVAGRSVFTSTNLAQADGYFNYGIITWTSGANEGLSMEVRTYVDDVVTLFMGMPYDIQVGDTFASVAGCDKKFKTCRIKFDNAINFKGEPHVPGQHVLLQYGKQPG